MCYYSVAMLTSNKHKRLRAKMKRGLTLIEMTVVIVILIVLVGMSMFAVNGYREWQVASEATQKLRMIYNAQRTYLAEHPTTDVADVEAADIIPYLSDSSAALPIAKDLDGNDLGVMIKESPPYFLDSNDQRYDPSGQPSDGLWDVGG